MARVILTVLLYLSVFSLAGTLSPTQAAIIDLGAPGTELIGPVTRTGAAFKDDYGFTVPGPTDIFLSGTWSTEGRTIAGIDLPGNGRIYLV